ncbi:GNAT family N-acetyltransferase [Rubellimicrobium sp. CFH 75288]|uniref:GNAT family N-acetyltransferase n=1 Tax=Rubellimicrobium sp. CFH 75288 TaxID=2697034 RepID=UPI00141284F8|nr:GNAT family N-acetyltransferase [Rubellimicrobium sp. CFH 75288]
MADAAGGRLRLGFVTSGEWVAAAQRLRHGRFIEQRGLPHRPAGLDADGHDEHCCHLLVLTEQGDLVGTARLRAFPSGRQIGDSYAAGFYDLDRLARHPGRLLEVGRLCVRVGAGPEVLRAVLAGIALAADHAAAEALFGCASFEGSEPARHRHALAYLAERHRPPALWAPRPRVRDAVPLAVPGPPPPPDALQALPPLLRTYCALGCWVSDHAVPDPTLDTLHVLVVLERRRIPPGRLRTLRALGSLLAPMVYPAEASGSSADGSLSSIRSVADRPNRSATSGA